MKLLVAFVLITARLPLLAQDCECEPGTVQDHQHRSVAKHETRYDEFAGHTDTVTVRYLYRWEKKYKTKTGGITLNGDRPSTLRQPKTPEDTLYHLQGFMYFVKQEENDCDMHIEIGPADPKATRIVVEIEQENTELQARVRAVLAAHGLKIMGCNTSSSAKAHFATGLPVIVTGLGFYDKSHKPNTNHGDAHTKKYSWELHPVADIVFTEE